jgi:hypothetical protein
MSPNLSASLDSAPYRKYKTALAWIILLASSLICLSIDYRLRILAADDSYIHLRIATHLMTTGHGYFNLGERVMVTSSPVWTLLLGVSAWLCHGFPAALALEAASMGLACTMSFLLISRNLHLDTLRAILLSLIPPAAVFLILLQSTIQQMESTLAVGLVLTSIYLFDIGNIWWLSLLVLAGFTRYEYFAVLVVMAAVALVAKRLKLTPALNAALVFSVIALYLLYQYGTLVPNTLRAKAAVYVGSYARTAGSLGLGFDKPLAVSRTCLLLAALIALATTKPQRKLIVPGVMVSAGALLDLCYIWKKTLIFPWYRPLASTLIVLGLILSLPGFVGRGSWRRYIAIVALLAFINPMTSGRELVAYALNNASFDGADKFDIRTIEYLSVGHSIYQECPTARLMSSEIGGLGEGFEGEILDAVGLATPSAIKYHPMRVPDERSSGDLGEIPTGFVSEMRPDVIVSYDVFAESLLKNPDRSTYTEFVYPALPAAEMPRYSDWSKHRLHILVARSGLCSSTALDARVRQSLLVR